MVGRWVRVKAWFDHSAFDAKVTGVSNGLLVVQPVRGAALHRFPDECTLILPFEEFA